jgi:hypothetical protein
MLGKNGSAIAYLTALSGVTVNYAGSTAASNFAGFEFGTVVVTMASAPSGAGFVVNAMRSGTSSGTFASFGASLALNTLHAKGTYVRSWSMDSSATWYMFSYDNNNGGSTGIATIAVNLQGARHAPITQVSGDTTVYSDVLGG